MKKLLPAILISFVVVGCATQEKYEKKLQLLVGSSEGYLLEHWGKPTEVERISERKKSFLYVTLTPIELPGDDPQFVTAGHFGEQVRYNPGTPDSTTILTCYTRFILIDGNISSYIINGDNCRSN